MKFATRIAIASAVALTLSAGSASAFNHNHHFGGTAKYFAKNASGASGKVRGFAGGGCGCYNHGKLDVTNSSEQYNSSFRESGFGTTVAGGESGSINRLTVEWKNIGGVGMSSNSGAYGASGVTNRRRY